MNNKMIFYSVLFIVSSMAIASEGHYEIPLARVWCGVVDFPQTKALIEKNLDCKEYELLGEHRKPDYPTENGVAQIRKEITRMSCPLIEKEKYEKRVFGEEILYITDRAAKIIVAFDEDNTRKLMKILDLFYTHYKLIDNNGWIYNKPLYIQLADHETRSLPYGEKGFIDDHMVAVELQPEQVEEILGLTSLRNWRWAKRAVVFIGLFFLIKNYSQLMRMINGR